MDIKKKICYSSDLGLFLFGVLMILLSQGDSKTIEIRAIIGEMAIMLSYFLFPFIDSKKKEKYYQKLSFHLLLLLASLFILYASLKVYVNYPDGTVWWKEILAATRLLLCITYLLYLLISFVRSMYFLFAKLISFLIDSNIESKYKNVKKIIEKIVAFIATATALVTSVTAFVLSLKTLVSS